MSSRCTSSPVGKIKKNIFTTLLCACLTQNPPLKKKSACIPNINSPNQSHANLHMYFSLQNGGYNQNPPSWSQSYTPVGGGCYNRCKPKCSFRPPPPPPMPMPPRPRPRPIPMPAPRPQPMPLPQPARPNYGCKTACRPMCNAKPSCGGGAQMNGNTMMCNSQSR